MRLAMGKHPFDDLADVHPDVRVIKSGKHYFFGLMRNNQPMVVIVVFHERMDLLQRLKNRLL